MPSAITRDGAEEDSTLPFKGLTLLGDPDPKKPPGANSSNLVVSIAVGGVTYEAMHWDFEMALLELDKRLPGGRSSPVLCDVSSQRLLTIWRARHPDPHGLLPGGNLHIWRTRSSSTPRASSSLPALLSPSTSPSRTCAMSTSTRYPVRAIAGKPSRVSHNGARPTGFRRFRSSRKRVPSDRARGHRVARACRCRRSLRASAGRRESR